MQDVIDFESHAKDFGVTTRIQLTQMDDGGYMLAIETTYANLSFQKISRVGNATAEQMIEYHEEYHKACS